MPNYPYTFQLPPLNVQDIPNDGAPGEFLGINVGGALDWLPAGGGGSGDMLAANNLSELTNFATARTNIGLGTASTPTFANLTLTSPSLSSSAPVTISQTWGTLNATYTAFKVVATETAVASTVSNLLELWSGSTPTLKVNADKSGNFAVTGTILADSNRSAFRDGGVTIGNAGALQWSQSSTAGATRDLFLVRDAPNTLALRNGAAAQTFRVYNTYTDASNYTRGQFEWSGGTFYVSTTNAGSGLAAPLGFWVAGGEKMRITTAGNVGIGTTAPSQKLEVWANSGQTISKVTSVSPGIGSILWLDGPLGQLVTSTGNLFITNQSGNPIIFETASIEKMRLLSNGNLGIGTTSPTSKLHVVGDAFLAANGSNTAPSLRIGAGANINGWYSFGGVQLNAVANSLNSLAITTSGTVITNGYLALGLAADVVLERDAQDELALRRGALGQKFSVYGTYPNATAWERFTITAPTSGNVLLGTYIGTGGVARGMEFQTNGVTRMSINSTGAVTFDSNVNINSSLRITFINNQTSALSMFVFASDATGASTYALGGSAPLMRFGGTTDSFPAIARDNAGIKFTGGAAGSTAWVKVPPVAVTALPDATVAGVGARAFVNDALAPTFGSAVTGGGSVPVPVYSTGSAWNVG